MHVGLQQARLRAGVKLPSEAVQRAWVALGRVSQDLREQAEAALREAGLPDLSWYTVLWELERAGEPTRPKDLATPLFILPYQLSRLVTKMEAAGLVRRVRCPEDRRGHRLEPTAKGLATRRAMWAVYGPAMAAAMGRIGDEEARTLARLLNRLGGLPQGDQERVTSQP